MISAARRARHCRAERQDHDETPAHPLAQLAGRCKQALDGAGRRVAAAQEAAGGLLARSVAEALQRLELGLAGPPRGRPLLASVSNSALDPQAAVLPSKNRAKAAALSASTDGAPADGEGEPLDERILISEVRRGEQRQEGGRCHKAGVCRILPAKDPARCRPRRRWRLWGWRASSRRLRAKR